MHLIQPLLNSFPPQTWGAIAGRINETPERTRQGLADALPMLFATMIGKASTSAGAAGLLNIMRNTHFDPDRVISGRESVVTEPSLLREGQSLAQSILGESYNTAARAIARHAGVAIDSAQSLLGLAAPLAFGSIAKAAPASGFTPEGLMKFLQGQREDVLASAPQGLSVAASDRAAAAPQRAAPKPATSMTNRILPWLIGSGAALLLALTLFQFTTQRAPSPAATQAPTIETPAPANIVQLPGGIRLDAPLGSIGRNLADYLGSTQPAPQTFTFDRLDFENGEVTMTPASTATLAAVATTLNAYPTATIRLDGHTDNVGERRASTELSLAYANAVARQLSERGVDAARITTAGFGPDRPVAGNDTEAGRAANRRLELTVTRK